MRKLIYIPKWMIVLVEIHQARGKRCYCQKLNREVKISINHLRSIVKYLEIKQLIEIVASKKIKDLHITEKGKRVAVAALNMKLELK